MLWRLIVLERWFGALANGQLARSPSVPRLRLS
jgi:hypothetical protein